MTPTISIPTLLDVALSLTFVFFIISMFVSGIWEFIGTVINDMRATLLRRSLEQMINSKSFANYFYNHPLIKGSIIVRPQNTLERVFDKMLRRVKVELAQPTGTQAEKGPLKSLEEGLGNVKNDNTQEETNQKTTHVVNYPSYIAPSVFSRVLLDLLEEYAPASDSENVENPAVAQLAKIQGWINSLPENVNLPFDDSPKKELQRILNSLVQDASDIKGLIANIESWYTEYMNRLTGYYKTYSQQGVRIVAIVVVLLFNLDAFNLTVRLYNDQPFRETTVADAISFTKAVTDTAGKNKNQQLLDYYKQSITAKFNNDSAALAKKSPSSRADTIELKRLIKQRNSLMDSKRQLAMLVQPSDTLATQFDILLGEKAYLDQLPFGWARLLDDYHNSKLTCKPFYLGTVFVGWILMVAAVSFGAPFWFDLLLKLVNIRNAGKNPSDKR